MEEFFYVDTLFVVRLASVPLLDCRSDIPINANAVFPFLGIVSLQPAAGCSGKETCYGLLSDSII